MSASTCPGDKAGQESSLSMLYVPDLNAMDKMQPCFSNVGRNEVRDGAREPPESCISDLATNMPSHRPEPHSEASTDVGTDDEANVEEQLDSEAEGSAPRIADEPAANINLPMQSAAWRGFKRSTRDVKTRQIAKIVDEFCILDFDAVDASAQSALVLRMLSELKSLDSVAVFYDEENGERHEESRHVLLGLNFDDVVRLKETALNADELCNLRQFRRAFDVLAQLRPRLLSKARWVMASATQQAKDLEAMALRRQHRKQRQRQERKEQRTLERSTRAEARITRRPNPRQGTNLRTLEKPGKSAGSGWW